MRRCSSPTKHEATRPATCHLRRNERGEEPTREVAFALPSTPPSSPSGGSIAFASCEGLRKAEFVRDGVDARAHVGDGGADALPRARPLRLALARPERRRRREQPVANVRREVLLHHLSRSPFSRGGGVFQSTIVLVALVEPVEPVGVARGGERDGGGAERALGERERLRRDDVRVEHARRQRLGRRQRRVRILRQRLRRRRAIRRQRAERRQDARRAGIFGDGEARRRRRGSHRRVRDGARVREAEKAEWPKDSPYDPAAFRSPSTRSRARSSAASAATRRGALHTLAPSATDRTCVSASRADDDETPAASPGGSPSPPEPSRLLAGANPTTRERTRTWRSASSAYRATRPTAKSQCPSARRSASRTSTAGGTTPPPVSSDEFFFGR